MYYFGTDGIRDRADALLSEELPYLLGKVLALTAKKVAVAKDVRLSGDSVERQLCKGLLEGECEVLLCGILPTPALAYIAKEEQIDCAVMITASHNPPEFNGLKVFAKGGKKLSLDAEKALDNAIYQLKLGNTVTAEELEAFCLEDTIENETIYANAETNDSANATTKSDLFDHNMPNSTNYAQNAKSNEAHVSLNKFRVRVMKDAEEKYVRHITNMFPRIDGVRVRLDCANGCFAGLAKKIFEKLGASVVAMNDVRDGEKVNMECGCTHMDGLLGEVRQGELGFAFDGDGDRVLAAVDGKIYDGDATLLAIATLYKLRGKLGKFVVGTILSSSSLEKELSSKGVALLRTDVGDKNISDGLARCGAVLGGEKSGHIIMLDKGETGDGVATALTLLEVYKTFGCLPKLRERPVLEFNIFHPDPTAGIKDKDFQRKIAIAKEKFSGRGRLVARPSGTEPYIRIYFESFTDSDNDFAKIRALFDNSES